MRLWLLIVAMSGGQKGRMQEAIRALMQAGARFVRVGGRCELNIVAVATTGATAHFGVVLVGVVGAARSHLGGGLARRQVVELDRDAAAAAVLVVHAVQLVGFLIGLVFVVYNVAAIVVIVVVVLLVVVVVVVEAKAASLVVLVAGATLLLGRALLALLLAKVDEQRRHERHQHRNVQLVVEEKKRKELHFFLLTQLAYLEMCV